ncbi:LMBR1-like membrane protein-domain-containing protein, partial [Baffinella frigidus]
MQETASNRRFDAGHERRCRVCGCAPEGGHVLSRSSSHICTDCAENGAYHHHHAYENFEFPGGGRAGRGGRRGDGSGKQRGRAAGGGNAWVSWIDDPWLAWTALLLALLALGTQVALRLLHLPPDAPSAPALSPEGGASRTPAGYASEGEGLWIVVAEEVMALGSGALAGLGARAPETWGGAAVRGEMCGGAEVATRVQDGARAVSGGGVSAGGGAGGYDAWAGGGPGSYHAWAAGGEGGEEVHEFEYAEAASEIKDRSTWEFYTVLKDYLLYALFFSALYALSFAGLRRYQRRPLGRLRGGAGGSVSVQTSPVPASPIGGASAPDSGPDLLAAAEDDTFPFSLCVLSVAVSLGAVLLVPLTMLDSLLHTLFISGEDLYGGLGSTNVGQLWELVLTLSNVCHFIVLPFAFFYTEAEGFGGRRRFISRLLETAATVALVLLLLYLLLYTLARLVPLLPDTLQPEFSYILTASLGAVLFLIFAPFGFGRLIAAAAHEALAAFAPCPTDEDDMMKQLQSEVSSARVLASLQLNPSLPASLSRSLPLECRTRSASIPNILSLSDPGSRVWDGGPRAGVIAGEEAGAASGAPVSLSSATHPGGD